MKIHLIIGGIVFSSLFQLKAQTLSNDTAQHIVIGRNFLTQADITAKETVFDDEINTWRFDPLSKTITLLLRGHVTNGTYQKAKGFICNYDLKNSQIRWQKEVNFNQSSIDFFGDIPIKTTENQSTLINKISGEDQWTVKNKILLINPLLQRAIGYRQRTPEDYSQQLEGIDLKTGETIWKKKASREYGINDIVSLNDTMGLIMADGLHAVDLRTGKGWDYQAKTGKKDYTSTIIGNIFSFTISALFQTENVEVFSGHDLYTDLNSNILTDSGFIYIADRKTIIKLNEYGNPFWQQKVKSGPIGKSTLFTRNNLLYLINWGFGYLNGQKTSYGKPLIAAYRKEDGKQVFTQKLNFKNDELKSYSVQNDTVWLMSGKHIYKFSLTNGDEFWENYYPTDSIGELAEFADKDLFIYSGNRYIPVKTLNADGLKVYTSGNKLLLLNSNLEVVKSIPVNELYNADFDYNGYLFLENNNKTIVINRNGESVAGLNISGNIIVSDDKLYETERNSLIELDLSQFK